MRLPTGTLAAAAALALAGCASESAPAELSTEDRTQLQQIADNDAAVVLARDWDALAGRFTEDAIRMPPNAPAIHGRDAIREAVGSMPPLKDFSFRMTSLDGDGSLAYMRGHWAYTLAPPGTDAISDSGKILIVFEKQADGRWLTVADAWNSDLPPRE